MTDMIWVGLGIAGIFMVPLMILALLAAIGDLAEIALGWVFAIPDEVLGPIFNVTLVGGLVTALTASIRYLLS